MSVFTYTRPGENTIPKLTNPPTSIPSNSMATVHALPYNTVIWQGKVTRSLSLDLDPGYYSITIHNGEDDPTGKFCYAWSEFFYHDITPEKWKILRRLRPRMAKGMLGTDGASWKCGYPGCREVTQTLTAAALHEFIHFGVNPLEDGPEDIKRAESAALESAKKIQPNRPPVRPPFSPRG